MSPGASSGIRLVALLLGFLAPVVLLEGLLQITARLAPAVFARVGASVADPDLRILCLGDSHTYGALGPAADAYPERLEAVLRTRGITARVFNRGIPGQSSAQLRDRLVDNLERYRPDLVLILVGINNSARSGERDATQDPSAPSWRPELRIVRFAPFLRLAREVALDARRPDARLVPHAPDQEARSHRGAGGAHDNLVMTPGDAPLTREALAALTAADLRTIIARVRRAGATPILLTYPTGLMACGPANEAVEHVATETSTRMMDLRRVTQRLAHRDARALFFADMHPTSRYYDVFAHDLADALAAWQLTSPDRAR